MKSPVKTGQVSNPAEAQYWRSIGQAAGTPEDLDWAANEFPEGAAEAGQDFSRRDFLKLMGASAGLAGAGMLGVGCRRPEENIVPFGSEQVPGQDYVHGVPMHFATAMPTRRGAVPLLVESNEGRPTKVEGNANHPNSNGAAGHYAQASVLSLYDPDRARFARKQKARLKDREAIDKEITALVGNGKKTAFLLPAGNSPTRASLLKAIKARLGDDAAFFEHEAIDFGVHTRAASAVLGQAVRPHWHLDRAKVILSLDWDFAGTEEETSLHVRDFARGRKISANGGTMSRLYVAEPLMSTTGMNADHRLRANAGSIAAAAAHIAKALGIAVAGDAGSLTEAQQEWLTECVKDLQSHEGTSLVGAGYRQPEAVHRLIHQINAKLGNTGKTLTYTAEPEAAVEFSPPTELAQYVGGAGQVINLGVNLGYEAADIHEEVKDRTALRLNDFTEDESYTGKGLSIPRAHYLESWGDARTSDGTLVPVQPLIAPLFGALSDLEVLAIFAEPDSEKRRTAHELVQAEFARISGKTAEDEWLKYLHEGFLAGSAAAQIESPTISGDTVTLQGQAAAKDSLEVIFARDLSVDDGRFANNGWCQEVPDPITKIVWDNVISVSRKTAEELGLENGKLATVTLGGETVEGAVWVQPGQADHTLALPLGYGRRGQLRIANFEYKGSGPKVGGFDAYPIRPGTTTNFTAGAKIKGSNKDYSLSSTQEHWSMEGRAIVRETTMADKTLQPYFKALADQEAFEGPEDEKTMFPKNMGIKSHAIDKGKIYEHPYKDKPELASDMHQWGMSIDLGACMGCNACVVACQSENNIPIVGKDQVAKGREMHWLRIDRYYTGRGHIPDPTHPDSTSRPQTAGDDEQHLEDWIDDPQVVNQPMACQHCEAAPCESVCPVNATVHDEEGLNVMAYNRCVGTRYCSNNCAWKVRRFNYFDYHKRPLEDLYDSAVVNPSILFDWLESREKPSRDEDEWDLLKLVKNPQVSVRMRGVMEKCTYCVQRIETTKIRKKSAAGAGDDVQVTDRDNLRTACQQACAAEAISFGNLLDEESEVVAEKASPLTYEVLGYLDTNPRTTYQGRVRNPNPAMPDAYKKPFSYTEYHPEEHGHEGHDEDGGEHHGEGDKDGH